MRYATLLALLATAPAAAHQQPLVHVHPHGLDAVAIGLAVAALVWLIRSLAK
jgi:hypothetical protein